MNRPSGGTLFIAAMVGLTGLILVLPGLLYPLTNPPSATVREPVHAGPRFAPPAPDREEVARVFSQTPTTETPARLAAVVGRVVDGLGHPVRGCQVVLRELLEQPAINPEPDNGVTVRTSADGRFRVDHPGGGRALVLMLHHEDFPTTTAAQGLQLLAGQPLDLGDLVLRYQPGLLVRAVSAATGLPLPGARVELEPLLEDAFLPDALRALRRRAARSEVDGGAVIYGLGAGRYRVRVTAEGYAAVEFIHDQEDGGGRSRDRVVSLPPGFVLWGRVLDPEGSPLSGARVRAEPIGSGPGQESARTDASGNFLIANLAGRPHRLTVESRTHGVMVLEPVAVDGADTSLEVRMPRGLSIIGTVLSDGVPVPGARVEASPEGDWPLVVDGVVFRPAAITDVEGSFAIRGLTAGRFRLRVQSKSFAPLEPLTLEAGGAPIALNLKAIRQVVGKVLDPGGRPLAGVQIEVLRSEDDGTEFSTLLDRVVHGRDPLPGAETGRGGRFVVAGLPAGTYRFRVRAVGQAPWVSETIEVPGGQGLSLPTITLSRGAWLSGRALGADGSAAPGAVVVADPHRDNRPGTPGETVTSDAEGRYSLGPLAAGSYELFYYFPEGQTAAKAAESRRLTMIQVSLQPGTQLTRDLIHR